jgi:hypothetical protein
LRQRDIGRRVAMSLFEVAEMRGAGLGIFSTHRLSFGRAAAHAGMAHRLVSNPV